MKKVEMISFSQDVSNIDVVVINGKEFSSNDKVDILKADAFRTGMKHAQPPKVVEVLIPRHTIRFENQMYNHVSVGLAAVDSALISGHKAGFKEGQRVASVKPVKRRSYPGETVIVRSTDTKSFMTMSSTFIEIRSMSNGSALNPSAPELDVMPGDEIQIFIKKRGGKDMGKLAGSTVVEAPEVKMIKVQSSTIAAIGHDGREFGNLRIQFCNKQGVPTSTYEYSDVPLDFFQAFMAADSKGTFLGQYKWKPVMSKYRKL